MGWYEKQIARFKLLHSQLLGVLDFTRLYFLLDRVGMAPDGGTAGAISMNGMARCASSAVGSEFCFKKVIDCTWTPLHSFTNCCACPMLDDSDRSRSHPRIDGFAGSGN